MVLPSYFDGWGAVVSESLMVGTPVICSDQCDLQQLSKQVNLVTLNSDDVKDLYLKLKKTITKGKVSKRRKLIKKWANCLSLNQGQNI